MSSSRQGENYSWLLVEWENGGLNVVHVRSVVKPVNKELKDGDVMTVNRRGEQETAKLVARARERDDLDSMIKRDDVAGPSVKHEEEAEDFSSSASSWVPSDDGAQSGDSAEVKSKKLKLERCKRQYFNRRTSKKIITPSHRANAVIPKIMQQANMKNRKRAHRESSKNTSIDKFVPDSTRKNVVQNKEEIKKVTIDVRELVEIRNSFKMLFSTLESLKQSLVNCPALPNQSSNEHIPSNSKHEDISHCNQSMEEDKEENSEKEEFNRSDDNVLITNQYNVFPVKTVKTKGAQEDEWIPIGSGNTLIHKDQFKKVNWKSYTIATRTLLLAVFPRKILATHSLTGKRSPAFQNKPAKMCLDPKITTDVIIEIMDRFNVRENLVRSIITTKCADECKMWKTRVNKKKRKCQENIPPLSKSNEDNQNI